MTADVYFHKLVTFRAWRHELQFETSQELFSAHDIDAGTRFLLRSIAEAGYPLAQSVLDMGCGYGPLGLTLKSLYPESSVHLTDRDALAVDYTRRNAELNGLSVEAYGSLGYDDVKQNNFDLIVSNIPGKAGEPVITYLLREAQFYLKPGGLAAVVIVSALGGTAEKIIKETPGAEVILKRERPGHTVFHYRFTGSVSKPDKSALERGIYNRKDITIKYDKLEYPVQTAYSLPEFDSLSYNTEILLKAVKGYTKKAFRSILMFNPGQGHVPIALWKYFHPQTITLADRDLLALRYSRLNLIKNGCPAEKMRLGHKAGLDIEGRYELIAGVLPDENAKALRLAYERAVVLLNDNSMIIISGGSTAVTRLVDYIGEKKGLTVKSRERWRGQSVLAVEKA